MESLRAWCFVVMICVGQGTGQADQDATQTRLQEFMFRIASDMGEMMADIKTLRALRDRREWEKEEEVKRGGVSGSCAGTTGLTTLYVHNAPMTVPCSDQAWISILRRVDNQHNFSGNGWDAYKAGFGNPGGSFFLGLENIHLLTTGGSAKVRVDLKNWDGEAKWAEYSYFRVEGEDVGYRLMVDGYTGNAGDSLSYHSGMRFSTVDRDNDEHEQVNCAERYKGGWWHSRCFNALLTGTHYSANTEVPDWQGLIWVHWMGKNYSYQEVEMKILIN